MSEKKQQRDGLRVCMVVYSICPADPRVRRESEALAAEGMRVDVVCLREEGQAAHETVNGVHLHRVPLPRNRGGKLRYLFEYGWFIMLAWLWVTALDLKHRYHVVHVHNMPDILVLAAIIPRLTGSRMILDLHDPMPELYMTKYGIGAEHWIIRVLKALERFSIRLAHQVLTPNIAFRDIFISRGCPPEKIEIVMNSPDPKIFHETPDQTLPAPREASEGFELMYHGTVVERHGLDIALEAVAMLRDRIPGLKFHVFGGGDYVERFLALRSELRLEDAVTYHGWAPLEGIAEHVRKVDMGLVPNKRSVFTEINFPTRLFEYLCLGRPVAAPESRGIRDYFPADSLYFFEWGSAASLADVIWRAWSDPAERAAILARGREVHARNTWPEQREKLIAVVRRLASNQEQDELEGVDGLAAPSRARGRH